MTPAARYKSISDLPEKYQQQASIPEIKKPEPPPYTPPSKHEVKSEKELQDDCESWLRCNGWWPRTPSFIMQGEPPCGWYIHLYKTKKNPLMLDLLLLANSGSYLEIELKAGNAKYSSKEQEELCGLRHSIVCRSMDDFIDEAIAFERDNNND